MGKLKTKSKAKITRYLPILLILLSITIMVGSTFAYFTDKADESSSLTFSKVELSSDTTVGIDGTLNDVIPGTPLINEPISFSKSIDSEAIYVRAKISFSLPKSLENDEKMIGLIEVLRNASDFNIKNDVQNGAVWSEKIGSYFYLLDNANTDNLKYVDSIDVYTLSEAIVIPRDLEQLEDNYQYMKDINFHIAFEAIQADNLSNKLVDLKGIFNNIFPNNDVDLTSVKVVLKNADGQSDYATLTIEKGLIDEPVIQLPLDENGTSINILEDWYLDKDLTVKFDITKEVVENVTLYPKIIPATPSDLTYIARYEDVDNPNLITSYTASGSGCMVEHVVIPEYYQGKPVVNVAGFTSNTVIKSIILPNTITNIDNGAFTSALNLETIKMSNNVTYIGNAAFSHCESLTSITLPIKLETILRDAFEHTDKLVEVNIEAVKCQSSGPMYGAFYVAGRKAGGITVNISSNVEEIPARLFYTFYTSTETTYYANVKEVIFEEGSKCKLIGAQAFYNCYNLEKINIPDSVTHIDSSAFFRCALTEIKIPKGMTSVDASMFKDCDNIEKVIIPETITEVMGNPFYYSSDIELFVENGNKNYYVEGNCLIEKSTKTLKIGSNNSVIPNNVEIIGMNSFYNCSAMEKIVLPSALKTIESSAFYNCSNIQTITIPNSVINIEESAFKNCYNLIEVINLSELNIVKGETTYGYVAYHALKVSNSSEIVVLDNGFKFYTSEGVNYLIGYEGEESELVLPLNYNSEEYVIYSRAFYGNQNITKITIPEKVTSIGNYAFYGCINLSEINYNATVISDFASNNYVFSQAGNNTNGITVNIGNNVKRIPAYLFYPDYSGTPNISNINIQKESTCNTIGAYAFYNLSNLKRILIPNTVTDIENNAFTNCVQLLEVVNLSALNIVKGETTYGYVAYYALGVENSDITNIVNNNGYIFYDGGADNTYLLGYDGADVNLILPDGYQGNSYKIYKKAFYNFQNLKSIEMPNSVTGIYESAFAYCTNLETVNMSKNITVIDNSAFMSCRSLKSIEIPEQTKTLQNLAFFGCGALSRIVFNAINMDNLSDMQTFDYAGDETDGIEIVIGSKVTRIPDYLFESAPNVISVEFEDGSVCESIGMHAFKSCNMEIVVLPDTITIIDANAFASCHNLQSINLPNQITTLGSHAFYSCSNLKNITIPQGVTVLSAYIFYNCTSLLSIEINSNITSIGNYAFYGCKNLNKIIYNAESVADLRNNNYAFYNVGSNTNGVELIIGKNVTKIPAYLFYPYNNYSPNISTVIFEDDSLCTSIGNYAFYGCKNITSIKIPALVSSIGSNAFNQCISLLEVINLSQLEIVKGETTNGYVAYYALGVYNVETSTKVVVNGDYVFYDGGVDNTYLLKYNGAEENLILPETYNGCNYGIYDRAFYENKNLVSITIPSGLISIGAYAFYNCTSLNSVNLPNNLSIIKEYAFSNCSKLITITIPEGLTTLGSYAFNNCSGIKEIKYNTVNMEDLAYDSYVFYGVGNDSGVTFIVGDKVLRIPGYLFYNSYAGIVDIDFSLNSVCTEIGAYAFSGLSSIDKVTIPTHIKTLGAYAFSSLLNLIEITFNAIELNDLTSSHKVFNNTRSDAKGIKVKIGAEVTKIPAYLFYNNNIVSVEFIGDSSCLSIGTYAFFGCVELMNFTVPSSIESIGNNAFEECISLLEVFNLSSLEIVAGSTDYGYIAYYALGVYDNTESRLEVYQDLYRFYNGDNGEVYLFEYIGQESEVVLPTDYKGKQYSIYAEAFYENTTIVSVTIPDSVISIGEYAFYRCTNLVHVNISNTSNLSTIGDMAFNSCSKLKDFKVTENVTSIDGRAFMGCVELLEVYNLSQLNITVGSTSNGYVAANAIVVYDVDCESNIIVENGYKVFKGGVDNTYLLGCVLTDSNLTLPDKIDGNDYKIFKKAFYQNSTLTSVTIPNSVTSIGEYAFYQCTNLQQVIISDSITSIEQYVFYGCTKLASINIPSNVTIIGKNAFYNCSSLTSIELPEGLQTLDNYAFYGCTGLKEVKFNAVQMNDLKSTNYVFYNAGKSSGGIALSFGDNVKKIPAYLFNPSNNTSYVPKFTSITFSEDCLCENIGNYAFAYLDIVNISLPVNLTTIGQYAFYNCKKLTSINIPDKVSKILSYAFSGCVKLVNVEISNNSVLSAIEMYAFQNCSLITSITIPESLTSLGNYAFYGCTALTQINYNAISLANLSSNNRIFYNAGKNGTGINVVIGAKVTSLPSYIFSPYTSTSYAPKIVSVVFEENSQCASIGQYAFRYCSKILSVVLPASITSIGTSAFQSTGSAYILVANNTIAGLVNGKGNTNIYVLDTEATFDASILFDVVAGGVVNGTYNDGVTTWLRTGNETEYVYYKQYVA